ncbi:MAG: cupin domain-containing protein [Planctomycetales bacterium]|nr:cupin domain-containing protein [Planctomycetales bacterium]
MKLCMLAGSLSLTLLGSTPAIAQLAPIASGVYRWADHEVENLADRQTRKIVEGTTPHFDYLEIHATTQQVGAKPRPPHANSDIEELIIVKEGLLKVTIEGHSDTLGAGSVVSLMPQQSHSLQNVGDSPLTYFVMRYRATRPMQIERGAASGGSLVFDMRSLPLKPSSRGAGRAYFDRATTMCRRLEMHVTQLHRRGPSHEPHTHNETEVILVISGDAEMMIEGKRHEASAGDFFFVRADEHHGVGNASDKPCSYFAFKWN